MTLEGTHISKQNHNYNFLIETHKTEVGAEEELSNSEKKIQQNDSPPNNSEQKLTIIKLPNIGKLFISICGIIGAGKSTLEEVIENPYLESFYKDMKKFSFPLQVHLLNKRFKQQQQIVWQERGAVQDRTIYEDSIFAQMLKDDGLLDSCDFNLYTELFSSMSNFMAKPNIIIFLDITPETSLERIKLRGRSMETGIQLDYLIKLHKYYKEAIKKMEKIYKVITIQWNVFGTTEDLCQKIYESL